MAINFNKLFLQNLLPKSQSTAHTQVSRFNSSEVMADNNESQNCVDPRDVDSSEEAIEQQERESERLSQVLESLRTFINNYNRKRYGLKDSPRMQLRTPPSVQKELLTDQPRHRRSTPGYQPYQVDAAPACKRLTRPNFLRTNERMSKKPEKVI